MTTKTKAKPHKQAKSRLPGASPISGTPPPVEHRFQAGQPSPNPNGRPRKMHDLQELIRDTLAEEVGDMTRAQMMIRTMLIKSPSDRIALLEYAFGKVPTPTHEMTGDEWRDWMRANGYTDAEIDGLVNEFAAAMGSRRVGAGGDGEASERQVGRDSE